MSESRGTIRERGGTVDLSLEDIIIEDVSDGAIAAPGPGPEVREVSEELSIEELPLDSIVIVEDKAQARASSGAGGDVLVDLEALTSEIDRIDRVVPEERTSPRAAGKYDSPNITGPDEPSITIDDFDSVAELNLDDFDREPETAALRTRAELPAGAPAREKSFAADDLPYDLIDDEFIILEEEGATRATSGAAGATVDHGPGAGVLDDELVRIHGEMSGGIPGSIIEENLEAGGKQAEAPAVQERRKARKSGELTIQIPEKVRKNLPRNFKMSDLGTIDLFEAEKIASEDILLLREEDLIEELDSMDLVPLDDEPGAGELPPFEEDEAGDDDEGDQGALSTEGVTEVAEEIEARAGETVAHPVPAAVVAQEITRATPKPAFAEPIDIIDESEVPADRGEGHGEIPAEPILLEEEPAGAEGEGIPQPGQSGSALLELPGETERASVEESAVESEPAVVPRGGARERAAVAGIEPVAHMPDGIVHHAAFSEKDVSAPAPPAERAIPEIARVIVRESIPAEFAAGAFGKNVHIIDDIAVEKNIERSESIFEENDLEKITSNMVEVVEGESKFLREASTDEDQDQIAAIMSGTALAFEDLLIDFEDEYKFSDEETGFIDNSFVSDAYRSHDSSAGGKSVDRKRSRETMALEIFGLTDHEISDIESGVFTRDYRDIDLTALPGAAKPGLDQAPGDFQLSRKYQYLGDSAENMNRAEKASVEEDLSGAEAYVFEESADDIRRILANYRKKKKIVPDGVRDISDEIVIIDDSRDMERFSGTMPAEKRQNVKSLLKYLDGLFEKLPEDVIRKFAESEYYNIYVKVLNELDR
jgi:hypothetical protein